MIKYGLDTEKVYTNNKGYKFRVIEFINCRKVKVLFDSGYRCSTRPDLIFRGAIRDKLSPSVYGVGINDIKNCTDLNDGRYIYHLWHSMMQRCYAPKTKEIRPTYNNCSVCDEWKTFSRFYDWVITQDYEGKQLDKDILKIGNKIYNPESCCFVTAYVNSIILTSDSYSENYPVGVRKGFSSYEAYCNNSSNRKYLGSYDTPEQAHAVYVEYKSKLIREVAETQEPRVKAGLIRHAEALENNTTKEIKHDKR